jgi:DNA adenine methylase
VRDRPDEIISELAKLRITRACFNRVRNWRPSDDLSRAVRLIYLNRTAFNGLYRVNQQGGFNVPFGCKPGTRLYDEATIRTTSRALQSAELACQDFRMTLSKARLSDVIYVDPPYTVRHDSNGFRRYNDKIFSWNDQKELAKILCDLADGGTRVIVSNAHHRSVRSMYPTSLFHAFGLTRATCMAGDPKRRGVCKEWLLISTSFEETQSTIREILNGSRNGSG